MSDQPTRDDSTRHETTDAGGEQDELREERAAAEAQRDDSRQTQPPTPS